MSRATFSVVAMEGQISFSFEESVDLSFPTAWWYIGSCDVSATRRTKHTRRSQDRAERGSLKAQKGGATLTFQRKTVPDGLHLKVTVQPCHLIRAR